MNWDSAANIRIAAKYDCFQEPLFLANRYKLRLEFELQNCEMIVNL